MSGSNRVPIAGIRIKLFGTSSLNVFLGVLAVMVLVGSFSALAITTLNKKESENFNLNGKTYEWDTLYERFETIEMEGYEGVPLLTLVEDAGVEDPQNHEFKFVGADGYFKTVTWRDMGSGIMTYDDGSKKVVFETKAKAYWVRGVVEIEVV